MTTDTDLEEKRLQALADAAPLFRTALAKVLAPEDVEAVVGALAGEFRTLLPKLPRKAAGFDANVEIAAWFLALRRLLVARGFADDAIGDVCLDVARERIARESKVTRLLQTTIARTPLARIAMRAGLGAMQGRESEAGFSASYVPGDERFDFGVDIHRCGIRRLFDSEGAGEFTKQMCRIDFVTTAANGLVLERAGTIGNGADRCDFRFRRA